MEYGVLRSTYSFKTHIPLALWLKWSVLHARLGPSMQFKDKAQRHLDLREDES